MADLIITLPQTALDHAESCATMYGYDNAAAWVKEWLVNSATQAELQKKQRDVAKLETKIRADISAMYGA